MGLFNKKELQHIEDLEKQLQALLNEQQQLGITDCIQAKEKIKAMQDAYELQYIKDEEIYTSRINTLQREISSLNDSLNINQDKLQELSLEIKSKRQELYDVDETLLNESFGIYIPKHECMNSEIYANKIKENRDKQKEQIKNKTALNYFKDWTLDGSKSKGQALNNDNMKMVLRAFNNECDVLISKVKFNNIDRIKEQIRKSAIAIDKLNIRNKISISDKFIQLKITELELVYEYQCKKQLEKEAIRASKAEEREQAKLEKEIQDARKLIDKEFSHYNNAKYKLIEQATIANGTEKELIEVKIKEIESKLKEIDKNMKDIDYREANQKAGYVYVISNIGAFGNNVYKIGMTRRLDPQERIDELGDASVPFTFDVHAMIFSDDAPALEAALHNAFEDKKVNMINRRKEFFNVTLEEIEDIVKSNHDKLVEFKSIPDAEQYRETQKVLEVHQFNK